MRCHMGVLEKCFPDGPILEQRPGQGKGADTLVVSGRARQTAGMACVPGFGESRGDGMKAERSERRRDQMM